MQGLRLRQEKLTHTVDSQEDVSWVNGLCLRCRTCAATRGRRSCGGEVANVWQCLFAPCVLPARTRGVRSVACASAPHRLVRCHHRVNLQLLGAVELETDADAALRAASLIPGGSHEAPA